MVGAFVAVLLVGFVVRSLVTLTPPLVVGDDGAYYLVQVRAILRGGTLAIPDFPLLFYVQAGVAGLLSLLMEQRAAVIAAVRMSDAVLPLALVVPVFLFARVFVGSGDGPGGGAVAVALVGLMALASGNTLVMAGGQIKNAVALPCSLFSFFASYQWLRGGRPATLAWAIVWFALASLTHMGGFVLSSVFAAIVLAIGLATPAVRPRVWLPAFVLPACLAGCLAILYALDPERAQRLVRAAVAPGWLFAGGRARDGAAWALLAMPQLWLGVVLGLLGCVVQWRHRAGMDAPTRVLLAAATLVTLALSMPLLRPDVLERLALLAYVPGMIPVLYLVCREAKVGVAVVPLVALAVLHGALAVKTLRLTALVPAAHEELVQYRSVLPPGRVIVITRPLLRWWVAWTMETHFTTRVESALAARDAYDDVLVLDEIRGGAFGVAASPTGVGSLAAGVRDAGLLRAEPVTTLAGGTYFRLSRVAVRLPAARNP